MSITQVETEDAEAQAAIFRGIDAYNDAVSGRPEPGRRLAVTLPGPDGRTVGGVFGYTYYDWLHLQLLAVLPARRARGLGTALLRAAEAGAFQRGCRGRPGPSPAAALERPGLGGAQQGGAQAAGAPGRQHGEQLQVQPVAIGVAEHPADGPSVPGLARHGQPASRFGPAADGVVVGVDATENGGLGLGVLGLDLRDGHGASITTAGVCEVEPSFRKDPTMSDTVTRATPYVAVYAILAGVFAWYFSHPVMGLANQISRSNPDTGWLWYVYVESFR